MNRDDIIRMAREAGVSESELFPGEQAIERFAELVAAHTKKACEAEVEYQKQRAQIWRNEAYKLGGKPLPWDADEVIAKAVAAEREACARVCDEQAQSDMLGQAEKYRAWFIADTIRARSNV